MILDDLSLAVAARRWPAWTLKARELDVLSVAAFPIQAGAIDAGVLTLYSATIGQLNDSRLLSARRLADIAFLGLLDVLAGLHDSQISEADLAVLLRADVHRAAGMVMAQAGVTIEYALARLRSHAFSSGRPITDVAADVLQRRLRFQPDASSTQ